MFCQYSVKSFYSLHSYNTTSHNNNNNNKCVCKWLYDIEKKEGFRLPAVNHVPFFSSNYNTLGILIWTIHYLMKLLYVIYDLIVYTV